MGAGVDGVGVGGGTGGVALIPGKDPVIVVSMTATVELLKSFDVPAATLVSCICPLVGVVNFVTVTVTEAREA